MRRRNALPDDVARDLEDLEAALAEVPGADPELVTFAADVRATRPEPEPAFLATLDARVLAGFGTEAAKARHGRRFWFFGQWPTLGLALASLVALVVGVSVLGGGGGGRENGALSSSSAGSEAAGGGVAQSGSAAADSAGAAAPAPDSAARSSSGSGAAADSPVTKVAPSPSLPAAGRETTRRERRVERAASLTLTTKSGDVQDVADGVVRETQAVGGYVQLSRIATDEGGGSASFTRRVPTARLDDALARLSKLAHVGGLTQDAADITGAFVSAEDRLADARAERRALLRALGRATTDAQVDSLRRRLRINRSEIARYTGDLDALRRRANLSTVSVEVTGTGNSEGTGGAWTPGDALHDAGRVLEVVAGVLLVGLAVLVPVAALGAVAVLVGRAARRRRREDALGAA